MNYRKTGDFRAMNRYIPETIEDMRIVSMED